MADASIALSVEGDDVFAEGSAKGSGAGGGGRKKVGGRGGKRSNEIGFKGSGRGAGIGFKGVPNPTTSGQRKRARAAAKVVKAVPVKKAVRRAVPAKKKKAPVIKRTRR